MKKRRLQYILQILTALAVSCNENIKETSPQKIQALTHNDSLLLIIGNKNTSDSLFACSVEALDSSVAEQPSFWADKANDPTIDTFHRKICAITLLQRHIKDGMLLIDFPKITGKINWLKPENISTRGWIIRGGGWKLSEKIMDAGGTCVELRIFPDEEHYGAGQERHFRRDMRFRMGLNQKVSQQNLMEFLLNNKTDSINNKVRILL